MQQMMEEKTKMLVRYDPLVEAGMIQMLRKLALLTEADCCLVIRKLVTTILVFGVPAATSRTLE
jgi:hypothetical protein